ncbi:MAG: excinuclease ABC subunit UvrA [Candidatus Kapabacteria bacterium]|nr:excinuclease ABC subunit UvrA [Candidatus Kapabacteria bacterium]
MSTAKETVPTETAPRPAAKEIRIEHARVNNLKNISVSIPRNSFTVITGVSGSGKSSLAFDTLYAEGQRRFVESLSSYARQFLERKSKPDVESITGLPPAIAIEQKTLSRNPRSTVGTTTEVYDYLRLLFGRIGTTVCKNCGRTVRRDTPQSILDTILRWNEGDRIYILFPLQTTEEGFEHELQRMMQTGYTRVMIDSTFEIIDLQEDTLPEGTPLADVFVVGDRLILRHDTDTKSRMFDSIDATYKLANGRMLVRNVTLGVTEYFSKSYECAFDNTVYQEPEPRLFSFNSPFGACPTCQGFGRSIGIDEDLVIPDSMMTLRRGAIHPYRIQVGTTHQADLMAAAKRAGIPTDTPVASFTREQHDWLWNGDELYGGIRAYFKDLDDKSYKIQNRIMAAKYRGYTRCPACNGSRLRTSARQVFVGGKNIPAIVTLTIEKALEFFNGIELSEHHMMIAGQLLKEIRWRLQLLFDIGVGYLTLDRLAQTLSGGESQRLNLATSLGSSLVGTLYVLDEPSIGLHPRDTDRLVNIMHKLRNLGNTVVVVEHDLDIIKRADRIIDIGPKAGEGGGMVMFNGTVRDLTESRASLTGEYLAGTTSIAIPKNRRKGNGKTLSVINTLEHNLNIKRADIPLGCITAVTGVSGSGKSTLIHDVLYANLKRHFGGYTGHTGRCERIDGIDHIADVEMVDQSPIGRSSRSTPVTYTKAFDAIREVFASTQAAAQLGWKPGHFSFNVPGGRCEACEGAGTVLIEMQFLPDIELECESCRGTRYRRDAQMITYKGKSIVDVLAMTIDEAALFFKGTKRVTDRLKILQDVGLGYLRLGQSSSVLSGGEAQRIKLATHLDAMQSNMKHILFIFDEPTTGLHIDDVSTLLRCFHRLVEDGHSVLIVEHNLHVVASADHIIDLGPEAGERGGYIVCTGTPEEVAAHETSFTGAALRGMFSATGSPALPVSGASKPKATASKPKATASKPKATKTAAAKPKKSTKQTTPDA